MNLQYFPLISGDVLIKALEHNRQIRLTSSAGHELIIIGLGNGLKDFTVWDSVAHYLSLLFNLNSVECSISSDNCSNLSSKPFERLICHFIIHKNAVFRPPVGRMQQRTDSIDCFDQSN